MRAESRALLLGASDMLVGGGHEVRSSLPPKYNLAGEVFNSVMGELRKDAVLRRLMFCGTFVAAYLSQLIEHGRREKEAAFAEFDFDRFADASRGKAVRSKDHQGGSMGGLDTFPDRNSVIEALVSFAEDFFVRWQEDLRPAALFETCRHHFYDYVRFLRCARKAGMEATDRLLRGRWPAVKRVLDKAVYRVRIDELRRGMQEQLMCFVFKNEVNQYTVRSILLDAYLCTQDRVWRFRGGRDGHETLQQFLNFLSPATPVADLQRFPGVVVLRTPDRLPLGASREAVLSEFGLSDVVSCSSRRISVHQLESLLARWPMLWGNTSMENLILQCCHPDHTRS